MDPGRGCASSREKLRQRDDHRYDGGHGEEGDSEDAAAQHFRKASSRATAQWGNRTVERSALAAGAVYARERDAAVMPRNDWVHALR